MSYAVRIRALEKRYPRFRLRVPVLELPHGTLLGVVGPNGAGKSTLLRILLGLVRPEEGRVEVLGHAYPEKEADARGDIGFLSEDLRLYENASLEWHEQFVASVSPRWDGGVAGELARRFQLDRTQRVGRLSAGQRIKAALLLALARRPRLLVLDEPTAALDPSARREVLAELMAVLLDEDRTVVFSSHFTQDVERIADRVIFLNQGDLVVDEHVPDLLGRWRRLHVSVPRDWHCPLGFRDDTGPGNRARTLVSGGWSPCAGTTLELSGAILEQVDRMSLEEIFLTHALIHAESSEEAS
ncbi:MAG: ABC transporter ATP-binding protein [Candidatus Eisenbacteria bacterium]|nr:ABC transporter ATP-binding protein [Candidatus Eisenbacteria bacterium]